MVRKPSGFWQAPIAASTDDACNRWRHSLLIFQLFLGIFLLSWTPVKAASLYYYDQVFMRHEMEASAYELDFAGLGHARALRPEMRAYAETLINDHARCNEALRDLARSKDVSLPPAMSRRDRQRLELPASTSDSKFDAAFLREARRINGDSIRAFRVEASRTADPDVRAFVLHFLDIDKKHQSVFRSLSNTVLGVVIHPPRTGNPMLIVPAPNKSQMPIIQPPVDGQHVMPNPN
jgi:putative membrane protein